MRMPWSTWPPTGTMRIGFLGDDQSSGRRRQQGRLRTRGGVPGPPRAAALRVGPYAAGEVAGLLREWTVEPIRSPRSSPATTGDARGAPRDARGRVVLSLVGYDDFELADVVDPRSRSCTRTRWCSESGRSSRFREARRRRGEADHRDRPHRSSSAGRGARWRLAGGGGLKARWAGSPSATPHRRIVGLGPAVHTPRAPPTSCVPAGLRADRASRASPLGAKLVYASGSRQSSFAPPGLLGDPAYPVGGGLGYCGAQLVGVFPANCPRTDRGRGEVAGGRPPDDPKRAAFLARGRSRGCRCSGPLVRGRP
jgi:hypothetical protein